MSPTDPLASARSLMLAFAERTGLSSPTHPPRRYLWTDAFAVCNFFELFRRTGERRFRELALALIDQVHETLGRHRPDDSRRGWISGLAENEGREHPTAGGLRIGKALPERGPGEPADDRREWDQDGQYFHYLTKWMHALQRAGQVTGDANFKRLARELAQVAHARFTYTPPAGGPKRMYWKMSIDLSRPLVASMGLHDPLDGLITYYELRGNAQADDAAPGLENEIAELAALCRARDWTTDDPLGLGGLLADALRLGQLTLKGVMALPEMLGDILASARAGLEFFWRADPLALPARQRLPFRELGLAIGLHAADRLDRLLTDNRSCFPAASGAGQIAAILRFSRCAPAIEDFWLGPAGQRSDTWIGHGDINAVMLATSLAPEGFLSV